MRNYIILLLIGFAISLSSCRQDFQFEPSSGNLTFSKDTVYLDTVFTNIGSSTYTLKVYNKSNKDIKIPTIQLGKGVNSKYRMTVDGMTGDNNRVFHNVELLAKDSMYVFIEVTTDVADANPTDFLYTDQIQFDSGEKLQKVELVTLIQDAYFIYPSRTQNPDNSYTFEKIILGVDETGNPVTMTGSNLDHNDPINHNEYLWNNDKPYVIYGYAYVPNGQELIVNKGARVHFHADSGLIIARNGKLTINGDTPLNGDIKDLSNEVIFEGDRLEPDFSDVPGQWSAIINYSVRDDNSINHLTLKNATVGIFNAPLSDGDVPKLNISNTQIYNCSNVGLLARSSKITGKNLVINNCGQASLACTLGGDYEFKHCTFNNNWPSSKQVAVLVDNYYKDENNLQVAYDLTKADFLNCIIFGSNQVELLINKSTDTSKQFNKNFSKCQIKFNNTNNQFTNNPDYAFLNDSTEIIKNKNPDFLDADNNKLMIGDKSDAKNFGTDVGVPNDILGTPRNGVFDLGAYQHITFPKD